MNNPVTTTRPSAVEQAAIGQRAHAALEAACATLPPDIVFRLGQSREKALALHASRRRAPIALFQLVGFPGSGQHWLRDVITPALGIVMLAVVATVAGQYSANANHSEVIEIDSALLTDDLPIDAYLDRGFTAWVAHQGGV